MITRKATLEMHEFSCGEKIAFDLISAGCVFKTEDPYLAMKIGEEKALRFI